MTQVGDQAASFGEGALVDKVGRAAELDQSMVLPVGSCIELLETTSQGVPCDAAHHLVVVDHLDLSDLATRPSDDELRTRCDAMAPAAAPRQTSYVGFEPASWEAGSRKGNCVQGEWDDAGQPILRAASTE